MTVDGFTIQGVAGGHDAGNLNAGIWTNGNIGIAINNNIIQNNPSGIAVGSSSGSISKNLIENNNVSGPGAGTGIYYFGGVTNWLIDSDKFIGQTNASIAIFDSSNITISNSQILDTGIFALDMNGVSIITQNTFSNIVGDAIDLGGQDSGVTISGNTVSGATAGFAAVHIENPYAVPYSVLPNSGITISGNTLNVNGGGGAAIEVSDDGAPGSAYVGALTVSGDQITTSGSDISIENTSTTPIDATTEVFNGILASGASTLQEYAIVDTIMDGVDVSGYALVTTKAGNVYVTPNSGNIQNAVDVTSGGDTLHIEAGSYPSGVHGNVDTTSAGGITIDPGASPGQVTITGSLTLNGGDTLNMEIDGLTAGTLYDQLVVTGDVSLGSATLNLGASTIGVVPNGSTVELLNQFPSTDPIAGAFAGLANGAFITINTQTFKLFYNGGNGNDVTLTAVPSSAAPTVVYVDDNWSARWLTVWMPMAPPGRWASPSVTGQPLVTTSLPTFRTPSTPWQPAGPWMSTMGLICK